LETLLALVEGWVDDVSTQIIQRWMPNAASLVEAVRRRRAAGGPAEQALKDLVGLELRPRRTRDAANLWAAVRTSRGLAERDAAWDHPDRVPTAADLDDPLGYAQQEPLDDGPDAMDEALAKLLNDEQGS
ncbi:MAG TPA: hydrolase, partial [Propionibacteriaceae bacterium]|nr:hydrolase [Propionibacteriaceae bacterium]